MCFSLRPRDLKMMIMLDNNKEYVTTTVCRSISHLPMTTTLRLSLFLDRPATAATAASDLCEVLTVALAKGYVRQHEASQSSKEKTPTAHYPFFQRCRLWIQQRSRWKAV